MSKESDTWETPEWLFDELNAEFNFDIDLCATKENSKCDIWYKDYLNDVQIEKVYLSPRVATMKEYQEIGNANYVCFMNPPYSNPKPFIEKAWEDSKYCKIVCLVKCDPSTRWWATFYNYGLDCPYCDNTYSDPDAGYEDNAYCERCHGLHNYNGPRPGCEVRFFPKRIKFDPPQELLDSGEVFKITTTYLKTNKSSTKWVHRCGHCFINWNLHKEVNQRTVHCETCGGKEYIPLSGPTFPSALVVMDRRDTE